VCDGLTRRPGDFRTYSVIKKMTGKTLRTIAGAAYGWGKLGASGHWVDVMVSPDGGTLLAQWSGECEVPHAFFIDTEGSDPVPVVPPEHGSMPESGGLGWDPEGAALIDFPHGYCGGTHQPPGVYSLFPGGTPTLLIRAGVNARVSLWARD
jgi:hypothetical protein